MPLEDAVKEIFNIALEDSGKLDPDILNIFVKHDCEEIINYIIDDLHWIPTTDVIERYVDADNPKYTRIFANAVPKVPNSVLENVIHWNDIDTLKVLVHRVGNNSGAIRVAALNGNVDVFDFLRQETSVKLTKSLFQLAVKSGSLDLVRYFLREEAFKPTYDTMFYTLSRGRDDMIEFLIHENVYKATEQILYDSLDAHQWVSLRVIFDHLPNLRLYNFLNTLGDDIPPRHDLLHYVGKYNFDKQRVFPVDLLGYIDAVKDVDMMRALLTNATNYNHMLKQLKEHIPADCEVAKAVYEKIKNKKLFTKDVISYVRELRKKWA